MGRRKSVEPFWLEPFWLNQCTQRTQATKPAEGSELSRPKGNLDAKAEGDALIGMSGGTAGGSLVEPTAVVHESTLMGNNACYY